MAEVHYYGITIKGVSGIMVIRGPAIDMLTILAKGGVIVEEVDQEKAAAFKEHLEGKISSIYN